MNIINITASEYKEKIIKPMESITDLDKILEKYAKALVIMEKNGFIFNEFRLYFTGDDKEKYILFKVEIDKDVIYVKVIDLKKHIGQKYIFSFMEWYDNYTELVYDFSENKDNTNNWLKKNKEIYISILMNFIIYVINNALDTEVLLIEQTERRFNTNKIEKEKVKTDITDRIYSLTDCVRKYAKHINHCKHTITCEHWEVRGHYRHYKSGKIVFIKPYAKGKNKEAKVKNTIYKI